MAEKVIAADVGIRFHFALLLANGEVVDSNFDAEPATCTLGDGNLLPGFEARLMGLSAGAQASFELAPAEAFGPHNSENVQLFKRARFAGVMLEEGLVVSFADAANNELPGVVTQIEGDQVTVDFNHPLAGKNLTFKVHILDVH